MLGELYRSASDEVEALRGRTEKFIGDAVMAVWGAPVAREDDPERAVRAALELVDRVRGLAIGGQPLALRAGVLSGEAAVTPGRTTEGMVAGDLVNTASRLQSVAPAGVVLVGEATYHATSAAVACAMAALAPFLRKTKTMSAFKSDFLRILSERGFIHQISDETGLDDLFAKETVTAYIGYDATARSLHVGHRTQIMMLYWLQQTGHRPIALMGGGTTKIAIVQGGKVIDTCAVEVGARLVAMDENGVIDRLEDTALKIARMAGIKLALGGTMSDDDKEKFSRVLCDSLFAVMERGALSPEVQDLLLTPNLEFKEPIHAVMFSGGVSEFVYGYEKRNLGDLGIQLDLRSRGLSDEYAADIVVGAVIGGLIGAKLWYVAVTGEISSLFQRGGFVWYGGFFGGVAGVLAAGWLKRVPPRFTCEICAAPLMLGHAIGRVGCFLVQDDYGIPSALPWAMRFPQGLPPTTVAELTRLGESFPAGTDPNLIVAVHPTQVYETVLMMVAFAWLWNRRTHERGTGWLFAWYLVLVGVERFLIEFVRVKDDRLIGDITLAQLTSLVLVGVGAYLLRRWKEPLAINLQPSTLVPRKSAAGAADG